MRAQPYKPPIPRVTSACAPAINCSLRNSTQTRIFAEDDERADVTTHTSARCLIQWQHPHECTRRELRRDVPHRRQITPILSADPGSLQP